MPALAVLVEAARSLYAALFFLIDFSPRHAADKRRLDPIQKREGPA